MALAGCAAGPQTRDGAAAAHSGALTWQTFAAAGKFCEHSSSWAGKADGLARGDVYGLGRMAS
ncbi:hypothetical protein B0A89_11340 [Paracoccus contaminans]|uniref:Uncharacterized protein n=1 Tax=Paracoccus contaminans TaxID=1945662 RepID=A0A1W6CZ53_9RHOB|nr:hypothetical protein B0A89_11340 [Paracoccus contaminans]